MCFALGYTEQHDIKCGIFRRNYLLEQTFVADGIRIYVRGKCAGIFIRKITGNDYKICLGNKRIGSVDPSNCLCIPSCGKVQQRNLDKKELKQ